MTEIKSLAGSIQGKLDSLIVKEQRAKAALAECNREFSHIRGEREELEAKLADATKAPRISDHAVIQYLERKHGFVFDDTREQMMTPQVLLGMDMGAHRVGYDGGKLIIKGRCAVTWVEK